VNNFYMVLAALAGAGLAAQAAVNTQLRAALGSALWTAIIQSALAVAVLVGAEAVVRDPLKAPNLSEHPWWIWTGGILGAAYVFAIVALTRHLGVALVFASIVVGQLLTGLLIDHYGWLGMAAQRVSLTRLAGAVLLVVGLVLIRWK
jgi:bacterial/archaeal transporter family-2 protein